MKCFLGRLTFGAIALLLMTGPVNADISASERRLDAVMAEYWEFTLREEPIAATSVGVNDFNDRMPHVTRADQLRRLAVEKGFLRRARDIDSESLNVDGQINLALFEWVLEDSIGAYGLNLSRIQFSTFSGFFMSALTASDGVAVASGGV